LSPDAQKILAQFDICLPKSVLVDPQIFSVKTADFDNHITDSYCWTISKNNCFVVGRAFPINNSNMRFEMLKEKIKRKLVMKSGIKTIK
jgi:uncharacterized Zn finger protein